MSKRAATIMAATLLSLLGGVQGQPTVAKYAGNGNARLRAPQRDGARN